MPEKQKPKRTASAMRIPDPGALLRSALDERWRVYRSQLLRTRRRPTEGSVHDLRVATRRLIAVLDIAQSLLASKSFRVVRKRLKRSLKGFNRLRDVHVQLLTVRGLVRFHPVLRSFGNALAAEERRLVAQARRETLRMNTATMEELTAEGEAALQRLLEQVPSAVAACAALTGAAGTAFIRAVERRRRLMPDDVSTIHAFRVSFKKLRYTIEALRPLLPSVTDQTLKAMNRYQTAMGEIQDSEVLLQNVKKFAAARPSASVSFMPVFQQLTRMRAERVERFMGQADEIYGYWDIALGKFQAPNSKSQISTKDQRTKSPKRAG